MEDSRPLEDRMGNKPSNNYQSDRPESGGADRSDERESSGLLEREKQKFAAEEAEKARTSKERANPASRKRGG
jgi:hypothetical protein